MRSELFARACAVVAVAASLFATGCSSNDDPCHHDLPSGTYVHKFDVVEKTMVVDRTAHTATISYDKGDGKLVVEHWRIQD